MRTQRGFTLIELLVVIAIIGILATLVITQLAGAQARARNSNAKSDVAEMGKAIETWKTNNNTESAVNSGTVGAATSTRVAGNGSGACTAIGIDVVNNRDCTAGGWTALFNTATTGYPVRVSKTPSNAHVYTYTTVTATDPAAMATYGSTNYCIATSVTGTTAAPDGAFAVIDSTSINKQPASNGSNNVYTYTNNATPCS